MNEGYIRGHQPRYIVLAIDRFYTDYWLELIDTMFTVNLWGVMT